MKQRGLIAILLGLAVGVGTLLASQTVINQDVYINGSLQAKTFVPSAGCVNDQAVQAGAGIQASKLQHRHQLTYGQPGGSASITERKVFHVVYGATAQILAFRAGTRTANAGAATVTFDCYKNGSSVLSGVVTTNSGTAGYALVAGTVTSANLVAGDVLEVVTVATAGGGTLGNGAFAEVVLNEDAQ